MAKLQAWSQRPLLISDGLHRDVAPGSALTVSAAPFFFASSSIDSVAQLTSGGANFGALSILRSQWPAKSLGELAMRSAPTLNIPLCLHRSLGSTYIRNDLLLAGYRQHRSRWHVSGRALAIFAVSALLCFSGIPLSGTLKNPKLLARSTYLVSLIGISRSLTTRA